ncbi:MAG: DUF1080 domain-containing protein, partial [Planctomycetes bacterium]|nr:DUF1080 domain-containing protein [Planctomycetota bacterium]
MISTSSWYFRTRSAHSAIKFAWVLLVALLAGSAPAAVTPLFDGASLAGWEGDGAVWRVRDGAIVGGSLDGNPHNAFLASRASWRNFVLRLEYRLVGSTGFVNSGVQLRSQRLAAPDYEMSGFQADIGAGYSGCLYDESRRKRVLATAPKEVVAAAEHPGEWNQYEMRCEGARIRILLNGRQTVDYVEREPGIALDGHIALQIHGDSKAEVAFRAITIEDLPADLVPSPAEILGRFADQPAPTAPAEPVTWHNGHFVLAPGETVVFAGQENLVRAQRDGALEARLACACAAARPRFRFMAWEGDTVYEQWRDLNFGAWSGQLEAVGAGVVVAQFGQLEAFDGTARLPAFTAAYHHLLDQFAGRARLVLVTPMPFEGPAGPHLPDLRARNGDVAAYAAAVRAIAGQRGALFVDLMAPLGQRPADAPRLTDDGYHLNGAGLDEVARLIAAQLGLAPSPAADDPALRAALVDKNRLFADCWRPANWSFVYGDRVQWPFAKPAADQPALRTAFEQLRPLVAERDARIQALVAGDAPAAETVPPPPVTSAPEAPFPTPEEERAAMTVATGFTMTLVASERDGVIKPTQIAWDERGRLYIACSPTYPHVRPGARPADFILACDGAAVGGTLRAWRYAEGLTMVEGLEPGDGGLYVCDFDQLVHLSDRDGDGRADQRRVLLSGFGIGDTHQLINSLTHGPDGSLWFTQGLHAFSRVETPWGVERLDQAGVWRLRPRSLRLEGYFNGAKAGANCWGVAFDDHDQPFHKSGDRPEGYWSTPGLVHLAHPDDYHPVGALFRSPAKTTSLDFIGTAALPEDLQGCAVLAGFFASTIDLHRLRDDGAGFASQELPKLVTSATKVFRPVDVSMGPDGAIYVADWCNPVIGHYQASYADAQRDHGHGRIWRIAANGRAAPPRPALTDATP